MYPSFLQDDDKKDLELGIKMGLILLTRCDELWVFGSQVSQGMAIELKKAKQRNMTIRQFTTECKRSGGTKR